MLYPPNEKRPPSRRIPFSFLHQRLASRLQLFSLCAIDLRVGKTKLFERLYDDPCHHQMRKPFIVRGNYVPRSMLRRRMAYHLLVGILVVVPIFTFANVPGGKFPVLFGFVQSRQESSLLFFLRKMKKKFADYGSIPRHVPLKALNILKSFLPNFLSHQ